MRKPLITYPEIRHYVTSAPTVTGSVFNFYADIQILQEAVYPGCSEKDVLVCTVPIHTDMSGKSWKKMLEREEENEILPNWSRITINNFGK